MPIKTLTSCYADQGAIIKNPRGTWSALDQNGVPIISLWADRFDGPGKYSIFGKMTLPDRRAQTKQRTAYLRMIGVGGYFKSIIIIAVDKQGKPRKTTSDRQIGKRMRLTQLHESTGEFSAEEDGV